MRLVRASVLPNLARVTPNPLNTRGIRVHHTASRQHSTARRISPTRNRLHCTSNRLARCARTRVGDLVRAHHRRERDSMKQYKHRQLDALRRVYDESKPRAVHERRLREITNRQQQSRD